MFLDTSGLLCFLHRAEPQHVKAVELMVGAEAILFTHSYVLAELIALALIRRFSRAVVLSYTLELLDSPLVEIIWVDQLLHREAMNIVAI